MSYQAIVKPEDKGKAVKTRSAKETVQSTQPVNTMQVDLEGKEVKKPKKVCPLAMGNCLGESCAFFADKYGVCGIQILVVKVVEIQGTLDKVQGRMR